MSGMLVTWTSPKYYYSNLCIYHTQHSLHSSPLLIWAERAQYFVHSTFKKTRERRKNSPQWMRKHDNLLKGNTRVQTCLPSLATTDQIKGKTPCFPSTSTKNPWIPCSPSWKKNIKGCQLLWSLFRNIQFTFLRNTSLCLDHAHQTHSCRWLHYFGGNLYPRYIESDEM